LQLDQNKQIIDDIFRALSRHDYDGLTKNVSEHCDLWAVQDAAGLPWGGHFQGKEGVRRFFELREQCLEQTILPEDPLVEGDRVVVTGGSVSKVRASGKQVEQVWVMVWTLKDGEIVGCRYFDDSAKWGSALQAN
jgi:ketosteroid isomerase-like protein